MQFNSVEFFLFLPIVYCLYWFVLGKSVKGQNLFLLVASYFFYGMWNWKFLGLIAFTSFTGWGYGYISDKLSRGTAKAVATIAIVLNIAILGLFKYYNFFIESLVELLSPFNIGGDWPLLKVVLPVGISFYTFQTLSYIIDVYKGTIHPTKDIIAFFAYVSYFPQLVAGPIERATNLLPQFLGQRTFDYEKSVNGLRQFLWGLLKKVVIADNCAAIANLVFEHYQEASWMTLVIGALAFTFQIYGDFSGYSDMAIGMSKLFGFDLMTNFKTPYFSGSIPEFWRRWHISLNTWFRDYVYIPLGGNKRGKTRQIINVLIVFGLSGLWHGANWTFIVWGLYFGILMIPYTLKLLKQGNSWYHVVCTFILVVGGWILFRSETISQASEIIWRIVTIRSGATFDGIGVSRILLTSTTLFVVCLMIIEYFQREKEYCIFATGNMFVRWVKYLVAILIILLFVGTPETFIYFQF